MELVSQCTTTVMSSPSSCDGPEDIKVEGLIVGGTTGEGHLLSWDEHLSLIAHTKDFLITSALLRFLQDAQQAKFGGRILIAGGSCKDSPILERSVKRRRRLVTADLRLQRSEILAATTLQRHLPVFSCCWLSLLSALPCPALRPSGPRRRASPLGSLR